MLKSDSCALTQATCGARKPRDPKIPPSRLQAIDHDAAPAQLQLASPHCGSNSPKRHRGSYISLRKLFCIRNLPCCRRRICAFAAAQSVPLHRPLIANPTNNVSSLIDSSSSQHDTPMSSDPRNALSALLRAADIEDHEQILNAANAALKADKNDHEAEHTKVVALLKLDRFDDALRLMTGGGIKLQATCYLEQAYALYKTGKLTEASDLLETRGLEKRSLQHIAAQVAYRAEKFHNAENIYRHLLDTKPENEESDLKINISAAVAQSQWAGVPSSSPAVAPETLDTFELCYNLACGELARGNTSVALTLLQRAAMLCDNSDELSDEDKKIELRSIRAQQAYLFAKIAKPSSALEVYEMLGPPT